MTAPAAAGTAETATGAEDCTTRTPPATPTKPKQDDSFTKGANCPPCKKVDLVCYDAGMGHFDKEYLKKTAWWPKECSECGKTFVKKPRTAKANKPKNKPEDKPENQPQTTDDTNKPEDQPQTNDTNTAKKPADANEYDVKNGVFMCPNACLSHHPCLEAYCKPCKTIKFGGTPCKRQRRPRNLDDP